MFTVELNPPASNPVAQATSHGALGALLSDLLVTASCPHFAPSLHSFNIGLTPRYNPNGEALSWANSLHLHGEWKRVLPETRPLLSGQHHMKSIRLPYDHIRFNPFFFLSTESEHILDQRLQALCHDRSQNHASIALTFINRPSSLCGSLCSTIRPSRVTQRRSWACRVTS